MNIPEITASKLERLSLCPGSLMAERGLPDRVSPVAEEGRRIHAELAQYFQGMPGSQDALIGQYISEANHLIESHTCGQEHLKFVEQRIVSVDGYSGQPDLVVTWGPLHNKCALVLDWKSGWIEQESSTSNLQLRAYAVLVAYAYGCSNVFVALLQRNAATVVTHYDTEDLIKAREEIGEIIREATAPGALRTAGETQCRYCKAIAICPEARASIAEAIAAVDRRAQTLPLNVAPEALELMVQCLTGDELAYIRDRKNVAEMVFRHTDDEIRRRLQDDPKSVPGWTLKPGNKVRRITDIEEAIALLDGIISPSTFYRCCNVSLGALEEAMRTNQGISVAQSKHVIKERLGEVIDENQNQPSIVRAK